MNADTSSGSGSDERTALEGELAALVARIEQAQARLKILDGQVSAAEHRLRTLEPAALLEANEALVAAMLQIQAELETMLRIQRAPSGRTASAQLQEANERLLLAALEAQTLQAHAEAAQRRQADSLAMVAHELLNPLQPIRFAVEMLRRPIADVGRVRKMIERQVGHLMRLIDDLLDVSRAETGKLRLVRESVDLTSLVEAATDACRPAMSRRQQKFSTVTSDEPLHLMGDPVRLLQILSNLLDNASKYTPQGGSIRLTVEASDAEVRLVVKDDGIGITPQALPHIFAPFVQEPHAVGFNGTGLGIGLAVVRELVESHGGTVVAHSAGTGLGSEFVVCLPRAEPAAG